MSSHIAHPARERFYDLDGPEPILYDDCPRCEEHAAYPMASLDDDFTRALYLKMVAVEREHEGHYRSAAEARACHTFYGLAVWLERHKKLLRSHGRVEGLDPWDLFIR